MESIYQISYDVMKMISELRPLSIFQFTPIQFVLILSAVSLIVSFLIFVAVRLDIRKMKLRSELQRVIGHRANLGPHVAESMLARKICERLVEGKFDDLKELPILDYISDFYVDYEFKGRLHIYLLKELEQSELKITPSIVESAIVAIDKWKDQTETVNHAMREYVKEIANFDQRALKAQRFIKDRSVFEGMVSNFVFAVRAALLAALASRLHLN